MSRGCVKPWNGGFYGEGSWGEELDHLSKSSVSTGLQIYTTQWYEKKVHWSLQGGCFLGKQPIARGPEVTQKLAKIKDKFLCAQDA